MTFESGPPGEKEIQEQNEYLLRRREHFRIAAERVATAMSGNPAVARVALIGSVAREPYKGIPRFRGFRQASIEVWHESKDVDLAVWVNDLSNLYALRKMVGSTVRDLYDEEGIGVAHHQVEVFMLEPGTDRYLGRLCHFNQCPKGKRECLVPGCGDLPFLQQHVDFEFYDDALDGAIILYERAV